jgi:hypothetical protein
VWGPGDVGCWLPDERQEASGERGSGDPAVAPTWRQRVSEVAASGVASPAEGRRRFSANVSDRPGNPACVGHPSETTLELCQMLAAEAATAKNRGIRRRERQRELYDPHSGNRRCTKVPRDAASVA